MAELVDGVTKLTNIEVDSMDEKQALTLRKMFSPCRDIRVIIVKLAHRLQTCDAGGPSRGPSLLRARETMTCMRPWPTVWA